MFIWFSENRANYNNGQVFPFLIAAIAAIIIMAMVTANLGKLSIFKTDVSNAADAGALAGAAILSSWLLGIGLNSDTWAGTAVVTVARQMEIAVFGRDDINIPSFKITSNDSSSSTRDYQQFGDTLTGMIQLYIPYLVKYYIAYAKAANLEAPMAWSNAKQSALRSAFQNAGVDEQPDPEDKFKHYSGTYDDYVNNYLSKEANMTGFNQFMQHAVTGYGAPLGEIEPGKLSDLYITSGYGWTQHEDETFTGSFPGSNNYTAFDNYVEVQVYGGITYPLQVLTFAEYFGQDAATLLAAIVGVGSYLKYIGCFGSGDSSVNAAKEAYGLGYLLAAVYAVITAAIFRAMIEYMPVGFTFPDRDIAQYTTKNPIVVHVKRHKKDTSMGMWNFQYGDVIAKSAAHAFQQHTDGDDKITIEPVLIESFKDIGRLFGEVTGSIDLEYWTSPETILIIAQAVICMGLMTTPGGLIGAFVPYDIISCDMEDDACVALYVALIMTTPMIPGGSIILQYLVYEALCQDNGQTFNIQDSSTTFNTDALGLDTQDWFLTEYHLFETELYPGYIQ